MFYDSIAKIHEETSPVSSERLVTVGKQSFGNMGSVSLMGRWLTTKNLNLVNF